MLSNSFTPIVVAGIDEAGRGPVLGPLCISCCLLQKGYEKKLIEIGVADSKTLTPHRRKAILSRLLEDKEIICITEVVSASEINRWMGEGESLNKLEEQYFASSLFKAFNEYVQRNTYTKAGKTSGTSERLSPPEKPDPSGQSIHITVYMDMVGNDSESLCSGVLRGFLKLCSVEGCCEEHAHPPSMNIPSVSALFTYEGHPFRISLVAEPKADARYPSVSAASIAAKVKRDTYMEEWCLRNHFPSVSGYPSDKHTISLLEGYMKRNGKPPLETRIYWETAERLIKQHCPAYYRNYEKDRRGDKGKKEGEKDRRNSSLDMFD